MPDGCHFHAAVDAVPPAYAMLPLPAYDADFRYDIRDAVAMIRHFAFHAMLLLFIRCFSAMLRYARFA